MRIKGSINEYDDVYCKNKSVLKYDFSLLEFLFIIHFLILFVLFRTTFKLLKKIWNKLLLKLFKEKPFITEEEFLKSLYNNPIDRNKLKLSSEIKKDRDMLELLNRNNL